MTRLNGNVSQEKERELIIKLYEYMFGEYDDERIENDIKYNYLTCNSGIHDSKDYFWYLDSGAQRSVATDMDGNIIDESNEDETLNGILYND